MKKIGIVVALIAIIGLILTGCVDHSGPEREAACEIITDIPWADNELTCYVIQDYEGNDKGTAALLIERYEDIYFLKQYYVFQESIAWTLMVNVRADNLKPLAGGVTTSTPTIGHTVIYNYAEGKLDIDTTAPEGSQHTVMDVPEDAYDDNEFLFLLRAIPFEVGHTATFTNVIATSAEKHVVTIVVIGEEELQVPAGRFDAYKVEISMAGDKRYVWYGKDKPHYLLKLDSGTGVILLKEIGAISKN